MRFLCLIVEFVPVVYRIVLSRTVKMDFSRVMIANNIVATSLPCATLGKRAGMTCDILPSAEWADTPVHQIRKRLKLNAYPASTR